MEKICYKILNILLFLFICISCTTNTDEIIKEVCTKLSYQERMIQKEISVISYLMVIEQPSKGNYCIYTIDSNVYQEGDTLIKYTKYFRLNDVYVFIEQKNNLKQSISKNIQEEIYNWGEGLITYEAPQYTLIIDTSNNKYKLFNDYEDFCFSYDSLLLWDVKKIESIFHK